MESNGFVAAALLVLGNRRASRCCDRAIGTAPAEFPDTPTAAIQCLSDNTIAALRTVSNMVNQLVRMRPEDMRPSFGMQLAKKKRIVPQLAAARAAPPPPPPPPPPPQNN